GSGGVAARSRRRRTVRRAHGAAPAAHARRGAPARPGSTAPRDGLGAPAGREAPRQPCPRAPRTSGGGPATGRDAGPLRPRALDLARPAGVRGGRGERPAAWRGTPDPGGRGRVVLGTHRPPR